MAISTSTSVANATSAIITGFSPASTCQVPYFTQLSSPGYEIWLAEPIPVPSTTASACYPSSWIEHYTKVGTSSVVSVVSPLVCPRGWESAWGGSSGYIACCPQSFELHPPSVPADIDRPAYGGTCYSDLSSGQTLTVTAYDSASITATAQWVASNSNEQVYAHPIDGYRPGQTASSTKAPSSSSSSSASVSTPTTTDAVNAASTRKSHKLSNGAIAGAVVGPFVAVLLLCCIGALLLIRRRRRTVDTRDTSLKEALHSGTQEGETKIVTELPSDCGAEFPTNREATELNADPGRSELKGN